MTTDSWCPENDLAWQAEQAEMHSCSTVEENKKLRARIAEVEAQRDELKDALSRIANYTAYDCYNEDDKKLFAARDMLAEDIKNCAECARAREINWPPSGMCSTHYSAFVRIQDSIKHMHEHKETYEPRNIAREALYKLEKM